MDDTLNISPTGRVSTRIVAVRYPPEPAGRAVVVMPGGTAYQRDPGPDGVEARWTRTGTGSIAAVIGGMEFRPTWRELHARGPVIVVWDPEGRDRADAAALSSYREAPDAP